MKALLVGLFLFAGTSFGQKNPESDSTFISGKYKIEISYSNMPSFLSNLIVGAAKIIGFAPKKLLYSEIVKKVDGKETGFRMILKDQDGKDWLVVDSDTSVISFAEPPRSERDTLRPDGVKFVADLRNLFKSGAPKLAASFEFGRDTLVFNIQKTAPEKTDAMYDKYHPSRYVFLSENKNGGSYMRCEFLVGFENGFVVYPRVKAHLYAKKMDLDINLEKIEIVK